mmetsp:Transcript_76662/g.173394  ORF Transcript_76662/g.173394 Transcript_76662/m.173394 type:complete len:391 (-) Transcript_76662:243-1415(-)
MLYSSLHCFSQPGGSFSSSGSFRGGGVRDLSAALPAWRLLPMAEVLSALVVGLVAWLELAAAPFVCVDCVCLLRSSRRQGVSCFQSSLSAGFFASCQLLPLQEEPLSFFQSPSSQLLSFFFSHHLSLLSLSFFHQDEPELSDLLLSQLPSLFQESRSQDWPLLLLLSQELELQLLPLPLPLPEELEVDGRAAMPALAEELDQPPEELCLSWGMATTAGLGLRSPTFPRSSRRPASTRGLTTGPSSLRSTEFDSMRSHTGGACSSSSTRFPSRAFTRSSKPSCVDWLCERWISLGRPSGGSCSIQPARSLTQSSSRPALKTFSLFVTASFSCSTSRKTEKFRTFHWTWEMSIFSKKTWPDSYSAMASRSFSQKSTASSVLSRKTATPAFGR